MGPGWISNIYAFCRDCRSGSASPNRNRIAQPCPCPQPRFRVSGDVSRGSTGACCSHGTVTAVHHHECARSSCHACWIAVQMRAKDAGDLTIKQSSMQSARLGPEKHLVSRAQALRQGDTLTDCTSDRSPQLNNCSAAAVVVARSGAWSR